VAVAVAMFGMTSLLPPVATGLGVGVVVLVGMIVDVGATIVAVAVGVPVCVADWAGVSVGGGALITIWIRLVTWLAACTFPLRGRRGGVPQPARLITHNKKRHSVICRRRNGEPPFTGDCIFCGSCRFKILDKLATVQSKQRAFGLGSCG